MIDHARTCLYGAAVPRLYPFVSCVVSFHDQYAVAGSRRRCQQVQTDGSAVGSDRNRDSRDAIGPPSEKLPTDALRTLYDKDRDFDKGVSSHPSTIGMLPVRVTGRWDCYSRGLALWNVRSLLIRPRTGTRSTKIQNSLEQVAKYGYNILY